MSLSARPHRKPPKAFCTALRNLNTLNQLPSPTCCKHAACALLRESKRTRLSLKHHTWLCISVGNTLNNRPKILAAEGPHLLHKQHAHLPDQSCWFDTGIQQILSPLRTIPVDRGLSLQYNDKSRKTPGKGPGKIIIILSLGHSGA